MHRTFLCLSLSAILAGCLPATSFTCETDLQCGAGNVCVAGSHACATPDPSCPGQLRYISANGGECVAIDAGIDAPTAPPPDARPFARNVCVPGPAMPTGQDACVDAVCAVDATCCTLGWTELCAQEAARSCTPVVGDARCPAAVSVGAFGDVSTFRFGAATPAPVHCTTEAGWVTDIEWADADGDGDVELAFATVGGVHVYEGAGVDGSGLLSLSAAPLVSVSMTTGAGPNPYAGRVAWGDADHDGDLDLAWYDDVLGLRVYRRDAGPPVAYVETTLIAAADIAPDSGEIGVAWMQLDADPDLELVASEAGRFVIFDREPSGAWSRTLGPALTGHGFAGTLDRIITRDSEVFVADTLQRNLHAGGNLELGALRDYVWADLDGDGHLDIVTGLVDGVGWSRGGAGGMEPSTYLWHPSGADADVFGIAVGDLDGDRRLDVFATSQSAVTTVRYQTPGGWISGGAWKHESVSARALSVPGVTNGQGCSQYEQP